MMWAKSAGLSFAIERFVLGVGRFLSEAKRETEFALFSHREGAVDILSS